MQRLGIFGGAFNPPHKGHVRLARDFADRLSLSNVTVIPSFIPPHKIADDLASGEDRLEMCRLAFCDDTRFTVSSMEIDRGGKSYTYDTLLQIKEANPSAELYLIIGSDMFLSFKTWYRYIDILKICTLCTAAREKNITIQNDDIEAIISDLPALEICSTDLRLLCKNGEDISGFVGEKVADYISDRGLYGD
ncbi:MAG: nicotinate-nucleotide adenylyltransferase [Eubacteriales bacterium]